jgi:hypothetical protein
LSFFQVLEDQPEDEDMTPIASSSTSKPPPVSARFLSRGMGENRVVFELCEREVYVLGKKRLRELGPSWPSG